MSSLRLPLAVYREVRAHGEQAFPHECCGALLGRMTAGGWQVDSLVRATNTRDEEYGEARLRQGFDGDSSSNTVTIHRKLTQK